MKPKPSGLKPGGGAWEDAIHDVAVQYMNARVCFFRATRGDYDPVTGTGGDGGIDIIFAGKARVQQLRAPREFTTPYQASASRSFRFQLDPDDGVPGLFQGVQARVIDGGRDSDLEKYIFTVNSAINSSHMAVRTVELISNMKRVDWSWEPPEPTVDLFPSLGLFPSLALYPVGA